MSTRRPAFRPGTIVMLHPDTNPDADSRARNDRGTVVKCQPMDDMRGLDVVSVVWDSRLRELDEAQQDQPLSKWASMHASTRLRAIGSGSR